MSKYFKTNSDKTKDQSSVDPFGTHILLCHSKNDQKALENYATWLRERHAVHNKIAKKSHRQSGELLMNIADESNVVIEEKRALEYTRIPQKFDKYRGNPEWWEFPPGLHEKCRFRRDEIIYFYQKTTEQKNIIPTIEKVGLPGFIKNEKMLFPRTRNVYDKWQNLNYRKNRVEELSSLLVNIEPHKPDFDRLIVLGKNIQCQEENSQTFCNVSQGVVENKDGRRKTSIYDCSLKYCLKINGVFFYENSQSLSTSRKFHVLFEYDVQSLPFQTQYIVFENVGRVTIRLTWQKMEKFRLFRDIPSTNNTEHFCFDKNMLILVPGQIVNFPIWFQTNKVCTVVETWEIKTVPQFWSEPIRVFFVLQAQTHIENFMNRISVIKTDINQRVKRRIIKEILEDIMKKSNYQNYKSIDYSYYEPELFEAMNLDDSNPLRKPKYMYDKELVEQLKKFYSEIRQSYHPKTWNLNVWDLQVLARVRDLIEYAELRTLEFSQYRASLGSRSEMMDDKRQGSFSEVKLKRKSSGSELDNQSDQFLLRETRYSQLMKMLWKMAPPSICLNEERIKFFQVYSIFNAYFTLMALELYQIKAFYGIPVQYKQKLYQNCPRLIFENFDDIQLNRTKRSFQEDTTAQPKPEILRDISSADVATVHNLYFMSSPSEFAFGKTGAKPDKKDDKKKSKQEDNRMSRAKQSQISSGSRINIGDAALVTLDFDPYEEVPPFPKDNTPRKRSSTTSEDTSSRQVEDGENKIDTLNIYVVIYTHLSYAVDAMVDTLESAKEYREPHRNIEQLKDCFKLFIEEESTETEDAPVNPFKIPEERNYFEKILEAHLNEVTGQYLICGKTEPVAIQRQPTVSWGGEKELVHEPSVFTLYKPEPQEVCFGERGAQTLPTSDVYETEMVSFSIKDICECPSEFRRFPQSPSEHFYYSDDEVFEDVDMPEGRKAQGSSSDEAVVHEVSKKKQSMPRASMSLMKEWNKKKCSMDDLGSLEDSPI